MSSSELMQMCTMQAKEVRSNNAMLLLACAKGFRDQVALAQQVQAWRDPHKNCAGAGADADADAMQAQDILEMGAEISARDKKGLGLVHFAAAHGHLDTVQFLWSKGAQLDMEAPGATCLMQLPDSCPSSLHVWPIWYQKAELVMPSPPMP